MNTTTLAQDIARQIATSYPATRARYAHVDGQDRVVMTPDLGYIGVDADALDLRGFRGKARQGAGAIAREMYDAAQAAG